MSLARKIIEDMRHVARWTELKPKRLVVSSEAHRHVLCIDFLYTDHVVSKQYLLGLLVVVIDGIDDGFFHFGFDA